MNRPGEIRRLTEIADPDLGLITNIGPAHLEGFRDITGVARAKTELIEQMAPDNPVLLNGDDELLIKTASPFQRKTTTFGFGPTNDVRAVDIESRGLEGMTFGLLCHGKKTKIGLRVPGNQNVINALAASAIALAMDVPLDQVIEGLDCYQGIAGRFNPVSLGKGVTMVDDSYNANPLSLKAALDAVRGMKGGKGRIIVCLGQMAELGNETGPAHINAGALMADMEVDYLLVMGDNAADVLEGALKNGLPQDRARVVSSHQEMARAVQEIIKPGDLILVKGSRIMELEKVSRLLMGNGSWRDQSWQN
jgi:UDP-N-acetylmuramoyl-tripeptide--D-alanyl-D-alanine ligase